MPNKKKRFFSYIRVSTVRQGQKGTSLTEQRHAISRHAERYGLNLVKEFEERETAAKKGRPVFLDMMRRAKKGEADGIVMHKIDRSARNLRDWAELGELIDKGFDVHFANENLDLESRGGRLSADIQAVVAADYIRNLRDEVLKGIYGRLKQGFYPFPAPIGYRNNGAGQPKTVDPEVGPLVRKTFELYRTERYGLVDLTTRMGELGLRSRSGHRVTKNGIASILHNPFYFGKMKVKGDLYHGNHSPLISKTEFDEVQRILEGKTVSKPIKPELAHAFLFRRLLTCGACGYRLYGECQKGFKYYRCHTIGCGQSNSVREDRGIEQLGAILKRLRFSAEEREQFSIWRERNEKLVREQMNEQALATRLALEKNAHRLSELTDVFLDGIIEEERFRAKRDELDEVRHTLEKNLEKYQKESFFLKSAQKFFELSHSAYLSFVEGGYEIKRELIDSIVSNFVVTGKNLTIKLKTPFDLIENRCPVPDGRPFRDNPRTDSFYLSLFSQIIEKIH